MLESLPPSLSQLKTLQELDVSHNLLQKLPEETGGLSELVKLDLSHNKLKQLPESMGKGLRVSNIFNDLNQREDIMFLCPLAGSLCSLRELVIYSNHLRMVPSCLNKLPQLKIDARDNPLGKPPTPPPLPPTLGTD